MLQSEVARLGAGHSYCTMGQPRTVPCNNRVPTVLELQYRPFPTVNGLRIRIRVKCAALCVSFSL